MIVLEDLGNQYGYEELAAGTAISLTASKITPTSGPYKGMQARAVLIAVEDEPIRIRMDGTPVTNSTGIQLKADTYFTIVNAENIKNISIIDSNGTAAVHVLFFF
jgi:hypothetical protein